MSYNSFYANKAEIIDESEVRKYIKSGSIEKKKPDWYEPLKNASGEEISSWAKLKILEVWK